MALKLYLRHYQMKDKDNLNIVYLGNNPATLAPVHADVPEPNWIEFTDQSDGLKRIKLTWSEAEGSHINTGIGSNISLYADAYKFVKYWVDEHVAAPLNAIEVRIEEVGCLNFLGFVIKADGLRFCDTPSCEMDVDIKQQDDYLNCIKRTRVADNHLGWFEKYTTKQHPRFGYCDDIAAWLLGFLFFTWALIGFIMLVIASLLVIVFVLCKIVDAIPGVNMNCVNPYDKTFGILEGIYQQISGCNRAHPAPLVRDYIYNVCAKCGINVNAVTAPTFFDPASTYYNTCYLSADAKKGLEIDELFGIDDRHWIPENEPLLLLDMFLDEVVKPINSQWRLKGSSLFITPKKEIQNRPPIFDFAGLDKPLLQGPICYEWTGDKKPAFLRGIYQKDMIDTTGDTGSIRMNDIVDFNNPLNPMLEGQRSELTPFGCQRYMYDGIDKNYLEQAYRSAYNNLMLTGAIGLLVLPRVVDRVIAKVYGWLLTKGDTYALPKLLLWDGKNAKEATVVKNYWWGDVGTPYIPGSNADNFPAPNIFYNTDVYGVVFDKERAKRSHMPPILANYPWYFDAKFVGNLYENFWQFEDPRRNPPMNKVFELYVDICCDTLKRLQLQDFGASAAIGERVRLYPGGYYPEGTITEIEINYDISNARGPYLKIKGRM